MGIKLNSRQTCVPNKTCADFPETAEMPLASEIVVKAKDIDVNKLVVPEGSEMDQAQHSILEGATYDLTVCSKYVCPEGKVLNSVSKVCVEDQIACAEGELPANSSAGHKMFDVEMNDYGSCQATACNGGFTLVGGICNINIIMPPMGVYGCQDTRAANYNPAATINDMSCVCNPGYMPYNPITGCEFAP